MNLLIFVMICNSLNMKTNGLSTIAALLLYRHMYVQMSKV